MATTETMTAEETTPIIPKTCKAGVVVNSGPDFQIEVKDVPVPEIGMAALHQCSNKLDTYG